MELNLDDLRYFLALHRSKTFLAAAIKLKVTHSTVSRRISALEETLNVRLFERSERGCILTHEGERLLRSAEMIESEAIVFQETISGIRKELSGKVRIGAPDGFGNFFLAHRLGEYKKLNNQLEIELVAIPMYYSLAKREIDLAITVKRPKAISINCFIRKLTNYKLGLYATKEYLEIAGIPKSKADLNNFEFVGYIDDLLFDDDLNFVSLLDVRDVTSFRANTILAQLQGILSGAGIGIVPYYMARNYIELIQILPEITFERSYWMQIPSDSNQVFRIRSVIDYIVDQVNLNSNIFLVKPD